MKKLSNKKIAILIAMVLILGLAISTPMLAKTISSSSAKHKVAAASQDEVNKVKESPAIPVGDISKNETVYAKLDSNGTVQDTTVVSWFHFDAGVPAGLNDPVKLSNPKALNGSFKVENAGDGIKLSELAQDKKDVFYSGQTDKALPVNSKISYYLDGKAIKPEQLIGKSGDVKIVVSIENQLKSQESIAYNSSGKELSSSKAIYTPLMTMVSVDLPIENFSNVEAPDGIVTAVGETMKVNWVLFPYPDSEATLTMKADKFELGAINMVVQPKMPPIPSLDMEGKLNELNDGLGKLDETLQQVEAGSQQLAAGQSKLADGIIKVKEGTGKLILLSKAEEQLAQGALLINSKLIEALQPYADSPSAAAMVKPLLAGLDKQKSVLNTMVQGGEMNGQTLPPMSAASGSLQTAQGALTQLADGAETSRQAAEKMHSGIGQIREQGITPIKSGLSKSLDDLHIGECQKAIMERKVNNYDTFMGKDRNITGRVQFIIQTEELK